MGSKSNPESGCRTWSPAAPEGEGLESGDLVLSYDHEPTTSLDRLEEILDFRRSDQPSEVMCLRRGHKLVLTAVAVERPQG
jgi:hypothetical protein